MENVKTLGLTPEEQATLEEARANANLASDEKTSKLGPGKFDALLYQTRLDRARREMADAEEAVVAQVNIEPARTEESKLEQIRPALVRLEKAYREMQEAESANESNPDQGRSGRFDRIKEMIDEIESKEEELIAAGIARLESTQTVPGESAESAPSKVGADGAPLRPSVTEGPSTPVTPKPTPTPTPTPTQTPEDEFTDAANKALSKTDSAKLGVKK